MLLDFIQFETYYGLIAIATLVALSIFLSFYSMMKHKKRSSEKERKIKAKISTGNIVAAASSLIAEGKFLQALDLYISEKDFISAARVALRMKDYLWAGELFERAGDYQSAANTFLKIPVFRRAAECLMICKDYAKAGEIYMQMGDMFSAAEVFEKAGDFRKAAAIFKEINNEVRANVLFAKAFLKEGNFKKAAELFEQCDELESAAAAYETCGAIKHAASIYIKIGKSERAAEMLEKHGEITEAIKIYEAAGKYSEAARLYEFMGNKEMLVESLIKAQEFLKAAVIANSMGNKMKAINLLQMISPADRGFGKANLLMGKLYEEIGNKAEAAKCYSHFVERTVPNEKTKDLFIYLAKFFRNENRLETSLKCLKKLKDKGFTDSGLVKEIARIEKAYLATVETMAEAAVGLVPVDFDERENGQTDYLTEQEIPFELLSRYEGIKKLGEGGTAVVFLAEDKVLKRQVVLKFLRNFYLPPEIAEKFFLREAQTVAQLIHPNIVTIFDLGVVKSQLYIVMEYLDGVTLDEMLLQRKQGLEFDEVVMIVDELAKAIDFAHTKNIIHRDIKPGNIFITKSGLVKLMDFGMAKLMNERGERSQYICGTPDYMSPEQESGKELTKLTDIYSFGVTILEMLCNKLPPVFGGREMLDEMRERYLETLKGKIPREVISIIRKCLSPLKENRPATAGEIARIFRKCSRGTKKEAGHNGATQKLLLSSDVIMRRADTGIQLI